MKRDKREEPEADVPFASRTKKHRTLRVFDEPEEPEQEASFAVTEDGEDETEMPQVFSESRSVDGVPEEDAPEGGEPEAPDPKQLAQEEKQERLRRLGEEHERSLQKRSFKSLQNTPEESELSEMVREDPLLRERTAPGGGVFEKWQERLRGVRVSRPREMEFDSESGITLPADGSEGLRVIRGGRRSRQTRLLILFCAVAALLIVILILNLFSPAGLVESTKVFFAGVGGSGKFPVERSVSSYSEIVSCGDDAVLLTENTVSWYRASGKLVDTHAHSYQNPAMASSRSRVIVYDRGGRQFQVLNRTGILYQDTAEGDIITATVGDDGSYAISVYSEEFLSLVTVYNASGKVIFRYKSADRYLSALALSPNGKKLGVGGLRADAGNYDAQLQIFSVRSDKPAATAQIADAFLYAVSFLDGGNLGAVFADRYVTMSGKGELATCEFGEAELRSFDLTQSGHTVLLLSHYQDAANHTVIVLDEDGRETLREEFHEYAVSVSCGSRYLFLLSKGSVTRMALRGGGSKATAVNPDSTELVASGAKAIVLGASSLDKIAF